MNMKAAKAFLLEDLKRHIYLSSWDFEADVRFAEAIKHKDAEIVRLCLEGQSPWPIRKSVLESTGVTKLRLRALRELVHDGLVVSEWTGTGPGGWTELNVCRCRMYKLTEVIDGQVACA